MANKMIKSEICKHYQNVTQTGSEQMLLEKMVQKYLLVAGLPQTFNLYKENTSAKCNTTRSACSLSKA